MPITNLYFFKCMALNVNVFFKLQLLISSYGKLHTGSVVYQEHVYFFASGWLWMARLELRVRMYLIMRSACWWVLELE